MQAGASFRDFDGGRRYVVRNAPIRAQAERRLREAFRDRGRTETPPVPTDSRLHALAARWLADVDDSELADGTKRLYRFTVHAYVLPGLGELRLREVTVPAIDRLLASVHTDHGPGAAKSARSVLSGILGLAVRHGLLTTTTPSATPPRGARPAPPAVPGHSPLRKLTCCRNGWPPTPRRHVRTCPTSSTPPRHRPAHR
ncbi:phage integrase central domain-containing protein [Geodermatophilus saharensis]|uniref:phage integrase central domain-containing protein n=1 Tax=Geodermatophilus saharensis TaxID=1137994 RepID=UPI00114069DC|nr:hypothetical protein [Geodermatophilus saharensis]